MLPSSLVTVALQGSDGFVVVFQRNSFDVSSAKDPTTTHIAPNSKRGLGHGWLKSLICELSFKDYHQKRGFLIYVHMKGNSQVYSSKFKGGSCK